MSSENPPAGRGGQTRYGTHEFHWEIQVRWTFSFDCLVWSEIGNKVINKEKENSHFLSWFQYLHPGFLRRNSILYSHLSKKHNEEPVTPSSPLCTPTRGSYSTFLFPNPLQSTGQSVPLLYPSLSGFYYHSSQLCFPVLEGKKKQKQRQASCGEETEKALSRQGQVYLGADVEEGKL